MSRLAAPLILQVLFACGGGAPAPGAAPVIDGFTASKTSIAPGESVQLTGSFSGGTGAVDNGVGAVHSGVPVAVSPGATTTYTLTVTGKSKSATASVSVNVSATGTCIGKALLNSLGKTGVLAGASMADSTAGAASWDARYIYLAGGIFDSSTPCSSCASNCTAAGSSCANSAGCGWWGCFQYDQNPPGEYVRGFVSAAKGRGEIPWFTYYEVLQASGSQSVPAEVGAVNNTAFLTRYLNDFRFMLQQIGSEKAFVHIEPDFWGFAELQNANAHALPAKVKEANPADCGSQEDSIAGLGRCMIAMARKYAANVKVGLHGSPFATGTDVSINTAASLDVAAEARKLGAFLLDCGAGDSDFVAVDASDRDAGYSQSQGQNKFWDATNATLPNFHQAFAWSKALAEALGVPIAYWQVPVGNAAQNNTTNHWKDNRVDYFFAHAAELSAAHTAAMLFGAGANDQTTPESDGGNLLNKAKAYLAGGAQPLCP